MGTSVLREDSEEIISDRAIPWDEFRGRTIAVTGGTGTLGSAIVRAISAAEERYGLNARIVVLGRDREKASALVKNYGVEFIPHDIREPLVVEGAVHYLFHCAALAKSSDMAANPVGVAETTVKGTFNALEFSRKRKVESMVFLSSMEIYGDTDPALPSVAENHLGSLDLNDPRSCYPEGKRMAECLCSCFHAQYGLPVKTARLAQTFGAGSCIEDSLVAIQFARAAMLGKNIVLHTEGNSRGNFCYISDAMRGLLLLLFKGGGGEAYNVAAPAACVTIREMADLVAKRVCLGKVNVVVRKPPDFKERGYARDVTRRLGSDKLGRLGWMPKYNLVEMYDRTIRYWRESAQFPAI
jgi:nucleoside-diphosphate-sugar epimerase